MSDLDFISGSKPIGIERGEGPFLYTADGTEYVDAGASFACTPLSLPPRGRGSRPGPSRRANLR